MQVTQARLGLTERKYQNTLFLKITGLHATSTPFSPTQSSLHLRFFRSSVSVALRNLNISTSALHSSVLQTEIFLSAASASGKLCIPPLVGAVRKMNLFRDRPTPRSSSVSSTAGATWGDLGHPGSVTPPGCRHSHRAKPREATSHSTSPHLSSALWWAVK